MSKYCWEVINCATKQTCPAFVEKRKDCWNVLGTMCGIQHKWQLVTQNQSTECLSCEYKKKAEKEINSEKETEEEETNSEKKIKKKMNCWEFMKCGRESGGVNVDEQGVCPAYPSHGTHCARVAKTNCHGTIKGMVAITLNDCLKCDFYNSEHYDKKYRGLH